VVISLLPYGNFSSFLDDCGNYTYYNNTTVIFSRPKFSRPKFYRFRWKKPCFGHVLTGICPEKIFEP
jgi:hypothetical protein